MTEPSFAAFSFHLFCRPLKQQLDFSMLTKKFPFLDPAHITPGLTRRLRALADDCARLRLEYPVSPTLLQSAPLLEEWTPAMTPRGVVLVGLASGHPNHGDRSVISSPVWFADPDGNWVRTLSRFYRLGLPAGPDGVRRTRTSVARSRAGTHDDASEGEA
jgi:hypothetical protein